MEEMKVKLALDLGNSEVRGVVKFGKNAQGQVRQRLFRVSNVFNIFRPDYQITDDYSPSTSKVFSLIIEENGQQVETELMVTGELQSKDFSKGALRPSATIKKYSNDLTRYLVSTAILKAIEEISTMYKIDASELNLSWDIMALLPARDVARGTEPLIKMIKGIKRIHCVFPQMDYDVKINSVTVQHEGFCAYVGTVFNEDMTTRTEYKEWLEPDATVLVLDIGAGTTDYMIIEGAVPLGSTKNTEAIGGNNVSSKVNMYLKDNYELPLSEQKLQKAMQDGFIKDGKEKIAITQQISASQEIVARSIVNSCQQYLEANQVSPRTINGLLVCGGGAIKSMNENIAPLSQPILTFLRKLAPNVEIIGLPTQVKNGEICEISPRLLNILGASILMDFNQQ